MSARPAPVLAPGDRVTPDHVAALTPRQREVLGWIAIGEHANVPRKIAESLVRQGFVDAQDVTLPGWPPVTVRAYGVEIAVHMAWCAWCATQPDEEDAA